LSRSHVSSTLRKLVSQRTQGVCEYCLTPEIISFAPYQVDHIIAEKHGGKTIENNLALACPICNKHKGSDIASIVPETQELVPLYHPRNDVWTAHFKLEDNGLIDSLTTVGLVTVRLLKFNTVEKINERFLWQNTELKHIVKLYLDQH
jgi:hypothetical protein